MTISPRTENTEKAIAGEVKPRVQPEICPKLGLPHQYFPQGNCQYCGKLSPLEEEIARVVQSVNEWDDRTSPDDYPEHLLITSEELAELLRDFAAAIRLSTPNQETRP